MRTMKAMNRIARRMWREWLAPFAFVFVAVAPLKSAVVDWNWVPTGSMKPTILEGDLVLVNKLAYDLKVPFTTVRLSRWGDPARSDIVVFFSPRDGSRLVKRVIGLPGDTVELRNEVLYVNGAAERYSPWDSRPFLGEVSEDGNPVVAVEHLAGRDHYVMALPGRAAMRSFGPRAVPQGEYFMMGDSRDNSLDSRFFGTVPRDRIVGRAVAVVVSLDTSRFLLPRLARFARPLEPDGI
jgi:signal peptidase I